MRTIAIANLKGGVGKTTSAVYLAHLLAEREPTVLIDTDIQGSALAWSEAARTFPFRVVAPPAPYLRDLARRLPELAGGGAAVVIDTPPGHPEIVRSAALAAGVVLIPVSPFAMDLDRLTATIDLLATLPRVGSPEVRVLLTNTRLGTNSLAAARAALQALGMPCCARECHAASRSAIASAARLPTCSCTAQCSTNCLGRLLHDNGS